MSSLKRVLPARSGSSDHTPPSDPTLRIKELTLGDHPGKTSEFVLTKESLYVTRPSDGEQRARLATLVSSSDSRENVNALFLQSFGLA
jgi:hypothetical protein